MPPIEPVEIIPADSTAPQQLEDGIAICLSGGGFRAMLFHLGALWRLQELRYLDCTNSAPPGERPWTAGPRVFGIGRVDHGGIARIAVGTSAMTSDPTSAEAHLRHTSNRSSRPSAPFSRLNIAGTNFEGALNVIKDILMPGSVNEHVTRSYAKTSLWQGHDGRYHRCTVFRDQRVKSAERSTVAIHETLHARLARRRDRQHETGEPGAGRLGLIGLSATAFTSGTEVQGKQTTRLHSGAQGRDNLQRPPFTTRVCASLDGDYPTSGLDTPRCRCRTIFVSDAGKPFATEERPNTELGVARAPGSLVSSRTRYAHCAFATWSTHSPARPGSGAPSGE